MAEKNRRWRLAHPEKAAEYARRWRLAHPEKAAAKDRRWHLRRKYGLSVAEFQAMFEQQDGRCAICGVEMVEPHIDHDHRSDRIRGLLCQNCNFGIGLFADDPARLVRAAQYLERGAVETLVAEVSARPVRAEEAT